MAEGSGVVTWNDAAPPALAPPGPAGRLAGWVRLAALGVVTALALAVFLPGRWLRRVALPGLTVHFAAARLWSRACLSLAGLRLVVKGRPIRAGAMVANHASWLDILPLRAVGLVYFVAKAEVAGWGAVGYIARITDTIFVERRRSETKRQEAELRRRIRMGQVICLFPEGTSTDGLRVLPFKSALFAALMDDPEAGEIFVQPVTVRYLPSPRSGLPREFYGWWGTMPLGPHVRDVVSRSFGGRVEVIYHPPVRPQDFPDRKALADHCQREVAKGLHEGIV